MKLTFRGHRIYSSIRLDETNTMVPILGVAVHIKMEVIRGNRFRSKTAFFTSGDLWRLNRWPQVKPDGDYPFLNSILFRMPFSDLP